MVAIAKVVLPRLARWVAIDVFASLSPFGAAALALWADGQEVSRAALLGHGELLLLTVAFAIPVLAGVVMSDLHSDIRLTLFLALLVSIGTAALLYGSHVAQDGAGREIDNISIVIYAALLAAAAPATTLLRWP